MKKVKIDFDYFHEFTRKWHEVIDYRGEEVLYMSGPGEPPPEGTVWNTELVFDDDKDEVMVIIDHHKNIKYVCGKFSKKAKNITHAFIDWPLTDIMEFNPSRPKFKKMFSEREPKTLSATL
jgi:hypothetical protein